MADAPPPLPSLRASLEELAQRVESLTKEMIAGKEADDWGRVTNAEAERRPLVRELIEAGFQQEGGEVAEEWLRWLLATENELIERGQSIRSELLQEAQKASDGQKAARAYERHRG